LAASIIPPIGFGTWPLKDEVARDSVTMALDCGFRHIDTAQAYDNEKAVGEGVRASGLKRKTSSSLQNTLRQFGQIEIPPVGACKPRRPES
jgi:predicted aldo/keto reductase-like oxidoreductase